MKNIGFVLLTFLVLTFSCTDRDDDVDTINIRIKNDSNINFDEVQVSTIEEMYTNVAPGEYSNYLVYEIAYQYDFVEIKSGDEIYVFQPVDFVGEMELPIGFYTYKLSLNEEGEVGLEFVVD